MRRRFKIRTRTLLLVALAVIVAVQGLSLFLTMHRTDSESGHQTELNFLLEVYGEPGGVEYKDGVRPELALFDPERSDWTLNDQPLLEFVSQVQGLGVGPHGSSPFVVIALPDDATVEDYRRALASLTWHGICRVGVYAPPTNREFVSLRSTSERFNYTLVPVYRILNVEFETGANHDCIDRFPAWAPWAIHGQ